MYNISPAASIWRQTSNGFGNSIQELVLQALGFVRWRAQDLEEALAFEVYKRITYVMHGNFVSTRGLSFY